MYRDSKNNVNRVKNDFYETPSEAIEAILEREKLLPGTILEPCAGRGAITKVISNKYPKRKIISLDINPQSKGIIKGDFLVYTPKESIQNIITNPPYKEAKQFLEKSLKLAKGKVIMLLQLGFLESKGRYQLFKDNPPTKVYVFSSRISCDTQGTKRVAYAWFVWDNQSQNKNTILDWILL